MGRSAIEWTDATWNPTVGCSVLSPGCTNCYAMKMADRIEGMIVAHMGARGGDPGPMFHYEGTTTRGEFGGKPPVWTGKLALAPDNILTAPLRWKRPRRIFVNSMSDLFHQHVPDAWVDAVFAVMALCPRHTFQVLTKRSARMRAYLSDPRTVERIGRAQRDLDPDVTCYENVGQDGSWPLPNLWLGVSAEDQRRAGERVPDLLMTPAAVRFVSAEPLLGPLDLTALDTFGGGRLDALTGVWAVAPIVPTARGPSVITRPLPRLDGIIVGGESGPNARPMHPAWPGALRDQCAGAGVPFFFKQWGAWTPTDIRGGGDLGREVRADRVRIVHPSGRSSEQLLQAYGDRQSEPGSRYMERLGRGRAGRTLDGAIHDALPEVSRA